jgi:Glycosyl transferase family 2
MTHPPTAEQDNLGWADAYRLRWKRRRLLWRSFRSRHQLSPVTDRTDQIKPDDVLAVMTQRNEMTRLPYFLEYHRQVGVQHFLIVDNDSNDGTRAFLSDQPDVSLWHTKHSYHASRFGLDWMTWLQVKYADGHWCLMLDADELLVYAHHDSRSLQDLTGWLDQQGRQSFGAHLLDLYPKGPLSQSSYIAGENPVRALPWFDAAPYRAQRQQPLNNLWVQGGVRERMFFVQIPQRSPTLNKIPLVKWNRRFAYVNSCHSALPRYLNREYDGPGGKSPSGVLLHTKFLPEIVSKSAIEKQRAQHFHTPSDFDEYYDQITGSPDLWIPNSTRYTGWQQLESLGLMCSGGW